jgi:hypothetical protein
MAPPPTESPVGLHITGCSTYVEEQRHVKKLEEEYAAMRDEYADANREQFEY